MTLSASEIESMGTESARRPPRVANCSALYGDCVSAVWETVKRGGRPVSVAYVRGDDVPLKSARGLTNGATLRNAHEGRAFPGGRRKSVTGNAPRGRRCVEDVR